MLAAAIILLASALLSAWLGMHNLAGFSPDDGRMLFFVLLGLAMLAFVTWIVRRKRSSDIERFQ